MSIIRLIEVPKWGLTMEEGTLSSWLVKEGQAFKKSDELCEIETSKIANALEASFDGVLRRIVAHPGETLPVGALLAVAAPLDVPNHEIDAFLASRSGAAYPAEAPAPISADVVVAPSPSIITPQPVVDEAVRQTATVDSDAQGLPASLRGTTAPSVLATPHALRLARKVELDLGRITGSGPAGRVSVADIEAAVAAAGGRLPAVDSSAREQPTVDDSQVPATPIARRMAAMHGINLHHCRVTGSRGRVCRADVEAALAATGRAPVQPVAASVEDLSAGAVEIPMSAMRRVIAARLQSSKQSAPHYRVSMDFDLEALLAIREAINAAVPGLKISVNDMLVKASAQALVKVPDVNIQYDPERQLVRRFADADIAVAVAIEGGLITPIVRAANRKSLGEISTLIRELSTRAKAGTLKPEEFQGGSFSISNLGMHEVRQFDAIINPPQAAILAVGAASERPVVRDGQIVIRRQVTVSLSSDHRVIDGALAATFLKELKRLVETPALLMA